MCYAVGGSARGPGPSPASLCPLRLFACALDCARLLSCAACGSALVRASCVISPCGVLVLAQTIVSIPHTPRLCSPLYPWLLCQARCDTPERRAVACTTLATILGESDLSREVAETDVIHAVCACLADDSLLVAAEAITCARYAHPWRCCSARRASWGPLVRRQEGRLRSHLYPHLWARRNALATAPETYLPMLMRLGGIASLAQLLVGRADALDELVMAGHKNSDLQPSCAILEHGFNAARLAWCVVVG